jgi:hypothetical protein
MTFQMMHGESASWGRKEVMECEMRTENDKEGLGKTVKVAEVPNMARHVLGIALVLSLSGQHFNRQRDLGEATK